MNEIYIILIFILCSLPLILFKHHSKRAWGTIVLIYITVFTVFNSLFTTISILILLGFMYVYIIFLLMKRKQIILINRIDYTFLFFTIWFLYTIFQMSYVSYTEHTLLHFQVFILGIILIWYISVILKTPQHFNTLYIIWGIGIFLTILLGWWEIITGNNLVILKEHFTDLVTINYYNPNNYSFLLSVSFPIIIFWIEKLNVFFKILGTSMLVSSIYFIIINGSRISLIVILLVGLIYLFRFFISKKKSILFISTIIIPLVIVGFVLVQNLDNYTGLEVSRTDESLNIRVFLYQSAWNVFLEHPLGVGPGQLELYMPKVGDNSNVHNYWLEILVNYGFLIFAGLVMFFIISLYKLLYVIRNNPKLEGLARPIFWSVIIFIPTSISPSSILTFSITWYLIAVLVSSKVFSAYTDHSKINPQN